MFFRSVLLQPPDNEALAAFLATLLAAYSEFEARFDRVGSGRGSKTETVHHAIQSFIADFSLSDLEKACPMVSRDMIRHVLFNLKKANQSSASDADATPNGEK